MQKRGYESTKNIGITSLAVLFVVYVIGIFPISDTLNIKGWMCGILLSFVLYKRKEISFTFLDCLILLCFAYEFINLFFSVNRIVSFEYLIKSTIIFCYYLIIRLTINTKVQLKQLLGTYTGLIFILSAISIIFSI